MHVPRRETLKCRSGITLTAVPICCSPRPASLVTQQTRTLTPTPRARRGRALPHVRAPHALVPRAAHQARGLWRAAPQRVQRRADGAHARAPLPAGRRAHLLPARRPRLPPCAAPRPDHHTPFRHPHMRTKDAGAWLRVCVLSLPTMTTSNGGHASAAHTVVGLPTWPPGYVIVVRRGAAEKPLAPTSTQAHRVTPVGGHFTDSQSGFTPKRLKAASLRGRRAGRSRRHAMRAVRTRQGGAHARALAHQPVLAVRRTACHARPSPYLTLSPRRPRAGRTRWLPRWAMCCAWSARCTAFPTL